MRGFWDPFPGRDAEWWYLPKATPDAQDCSHVDDQVAGHAQRSTYLRSLLLPVCPEPAVAQSRTSAVR